MGQYGRRMDDKYLEHELNQIKRRNNFNLNELPQEDDNIESGDSVKKRNNLVKNDFQPFSG